MLELQMTQLLTSSRLCCLLLLQRTLSGVLEVSFTVSDTSVGQKSVQRAYLENMLISEQ